MIKESQIIQRLDKLYHDLPLEYAGYALSAIYDIEQILYGADKGYEIGTEAERQEFEENRNK